MSVLQVVVFIIS